jgi:hypothetical protein
MATITPQTVALAAEAFNTARGLSPLARRLGIALVGRADRKTGICHPSEARLACQLGVTDRGIRKAKRELQARGFLAWETPGKWLRCRYRLAWSRLVEVTYEIRKQSREASHAAVGALAEAAAKRQREWLLKLHAMRRDTGRNGRSYYPNSHNQYLNSSLAPQGGNRLASLRGDRPQWALEGESRAYSEIQSQRFEGLEASPALIAAMETRKPKPLSREMAENFRQWAREAAEAGDHETARAFLEEAAA